MDEFWKLTDYETKKERIVDFIRCEVAKSDGKNAVIGLSGGLDSATVTGLSSLALGSKNVNAYFLPTKITKEEDGKHAELIAKLFGVNFKVISISDHVESHSRDPDLRQNEKALGNVQARLRMIELYKRNELHHKGLVVGTSNYTELLLGYGTKHGDIACDIAPILHLYKTQVRELATHLKIPDSITCKNPSPGLWIKQTSEGELAAKIGVKYCGKPYELYEKIDSFFYNLFNLKNDFRVACYSANISDETGKRLINIYHSNEHKRRMPTSLL
jgi:NAD+ synthase